MVRGENLRFREEGVKDVLKDVLLPWFNAYRFLVQNVQRWEEVTFLFNLALRFCYAFLVRPA